MNKIASGLLIFTFAAASLTASSSQAVVYEVNRTFGIPSATLTGTVDVPLGNYVIQNETPNPFTDVNLTLTVNAFPYSLTYALTDLVDGTGQFFVDATPTTLTFSTANGDGSNPADLVFSVSSNPFDDRYAIGSNGDPNFEAAITGAGNVIADVDFPVVFGTAVVPEPTSLVFILAAGMILSGRRFRR